MRLLGSGPVADVYAVAGSALKVFPGKFDRRTLAAVERDRAKLAKLSAAVLPVEHVEVVDGRHALRMELCAESLASRVRRDGPLPPDEVAALGGALSRALVAAHRVDVLHGGVSPSNVLFRATGEPVLADFGIALRQAFRRDPLYGIEWVSPETLRTGVADARTDLYGLGAVLHFALTGESPHPSRIGEMTGERILRVLGDPVPAISRPDVPIGLSTAIGRLLAPEAAKRTLLMAEDVSAESPPRRSFSWWHVAAAGVLAAVLVALVFWPRREGQPPPATIAPVITLILDEPVDLGDQVSLTWSTNDDKLFFAVVVWPEGEKADTLLAEHNHTMKVPVEAGRKYCFLVRGTKGDQVVESRPVGVRGAVCSR
ncbi:serine/threonine-protein kinase [Actinosynnema sp. CS-041913]|uniref:serine/threonine-protein kinase n=1 Tax=Actinosynnema sp. CS-041913 TaxID=3239917 RepID=UPI003D904753